MAIINLSAPWIKFYREIDAMFKYDPEVNVIFDAEQMNVKVLVDNQEKAEALSLILVKSKKFGMTEVTVSVIPANVRQPQKGFIYPKRRGHRYISADNATSAYRIAFEGNPVFRYEANTGGDLAFNAHYVVFRNEVVQFFNDDLSDLNGVCSTLYQEIAKDIFDKPADAVGTYYCTEYCPPRDDQECGI